ncbi:glycosyltransferase [Georgenia sp. MJ173]|uniref:glycosyltransferase n=1 Tax=Georgenia sunbinii TaxID=3117728 RepID=UPI002F264E5B
MTSPGPQRSILVVTVVHHPQDARIRHREIDALLRAGWRVTYAAPFSGHGLAVPEPEGGLRCVDLPRSAGRRRLRALGHARRTIRELGPRNDVVLIHDPELLLATGRQRNVVWDVHEDTAAAVGAKEWLPRAVQRAAAAVLRSVERWAERRMPLLLAEYAYQERFRRRHPVVPNVVSVPRAMPPPGADRVVYLGSITLERGAEDVVALARTLTDRTAGELQTHVIGPAHGAAEALIAAAHDEGVLQWHGFVPNEEALTMLDGALAGLSLLRDVPNYRHSMPTKVLEYMAHGVPVVTTPLPVARDVVERSGCGVLVPFADPDAAAAAVLALRADPSRAARLGRAGHAAVLRDYDWSSAGEQFVATMATLADPARRAGGATAVR